MRPLAAMLGIVLGSSVAIWAGLSLTLVVFLFLPEYQDRLVNEWSPLLKATGASLVLALVAAAAFLGEIRLQPWRRWAHGLLVLVAAALVFLYWP